MTDRTDTIEPDDKDWTWVLERPCPECGYDASTLDVTATGAIVGGLTERWREVLASSAVRTRPQPGIWSPLEYGCHVRDVFELFATRLQLMLTHDDPLFDNWNQDDTAQAERYDQQDPGTVADQLDAAGVRNAALFDTVVNDQWQRTGRRSDGASFTVDSFARYFLHDPIHHLWDVGAPFDVTVLDS